MAANVWSAILMFDRPDFEKGIETFYFREEIPVPSVFDRPDFEKGIETSL